MHYLNRFYILCNIQLNIYLYHICKKHFKLRVSIDIHNKNICILHPNTMEAILLYKPIIYSFYKESFFNRTVSRLKKIEVCLECLYIWIYTSIHPTKSHYVMDFHRILYSLFWYNTNTSTCIFSALSIKFKYFIEEITCIAQMVLLE